MVNRPKDAANKGAALRRLESLGAERGIASGILGTSTEDAATRRDQGFGLIALGSDVGLLIRQARGSLLELRNR